MYKRAGLVIGVCVFSLQLGIAQTTGTVSGVVRDATGGVVPGASVAVRNVETGITRTLPTDAQGRYQAANLSVGQYEVEISLSGFRTEVRSGIGLTVAQEAVVNFTMQVGQVAERVEVTGEAPLVETTNSAITGLADENTIRDLPLNGRSFTDIVTLQVGTVLGRADRGAEVGGGDALGGGSKISISGARPGQNSYLLDGTDINDSRPAAPGAASGLMLGVDSVREFRLLTNSYSAEYGRSSGGVLTAVTKSGTNDFHGTLFEFLRNSKLDAARWEDTARSTTKLKPSFKRNQFGGTIGGPVVKNKTFFFGSFEALRDRTGRSSTIQVPTARARQGFLPLNGTTGAAEACATNLNPCAPAPSVVPWLALYPLPNSTVVGRGDLRNGTGDHDYVALQPTDQEYFSARGDHQFSASHSLFGRFTFDDSARIAPSRPAPLPDRQVYNSRNQYLTVQHDSIVSATTLNTARFGMNRSKAREVMTYLDSFDTNGMSFVPGVPFNLGGTISVSDIAAIGTSRVPRGDHYRLFEGSDDLTLIRGSHTLKTGVVFKKIASFEETFNQAAGEMSFGGNVAPASGTRSTGLWDFLQGRPNQFSLQWPGGSNENREWNQKFIGVYLQDDFKWKPNFTWNLGARLEFMTSPMETDSQCANLTDPRQILPINRAGAPHPKALAGAPLGKVGCPFFETFKNNWAPRVGFAWDTRSNSKLVLRGGFGLFYDQPFSNFWKAAGRCCPPYSLEVQVPKPPFAKANTFLNFNNPPEDPLDARTYNYTGTSYLMQYNLNIQSEIRSGTGVTIGFSGSQGRKLPITRQLNMPPMTILPDGRFQILNADAPTAPQRATALQLLNPMWNSVLLGATVGSSNYNALLVSVNQRFSGGLRAGLAYTYSKTMSHNDTVYGADFGGGDGQTGTQNGYNIGADWGVATYSLRHNFSLNYSYNLPFQGQGLAGKVIQGWQISGIVSRQSGVPFSAVSQFRPDHGSGVTRIGQQRPDLVPGKSNNPILGGPDTYFDASSFSYDRNGDGVVTDADRGFFGTLGRNTLTGPGLVNLDFSLIKNTSIREGTNLQFRAEFFNIANHPNFRNPEARIFQSNGNVRTDIGRIIQTTTQSRQIQFALKLLF